MTLADVVRNQVTGRAVGVPPVPVRTIMPSRFLDGNATQPLRPEARDAVLAAFDVTGNPSSVHRAGRSARRIMEDAREAIAGRFGALPGNLVFTSGGTEADALAIHGLGQGRRVLISAIEHDAVRFAASDAVVVPVGPDGVCDLAALEALLADGVPSLVCLMLANNETGVIQPVEQAAAICRRHGVLLHVDAVQAAGRMPVRLDRLGAHSLAISSHKLGGPTGVGALLLAPDAPFAAALIGGGGQERGRRGGTSPVALIAGFAAAAEAGIADELETLAALRDRGGAGGHCLRGCGMRRSGAAAAQYELHRAAGGGGGCAGDRTRSGGDRHQRRVGVQLGQGTTEPRASGNGAGCAGGSGDPRVAAMERDRSGCRRVRRGLSARGWPVVSRSGDAGRVILIQSHDPASIAPQSARLSG